MSTRSLGVKAARSVQERVDNEGFDYAFRHYSDFEDITDAHFHELRKAYVAAAEALSEYCGIDD